MPVIIIWYNICTKVKDMTYVNLAFTPVRCQKLRPRTQAIPGCAPLRRAQDAHLWHGYWGRGLRYSSNAKSRCQGCQSAFATTKTWKSDKLICILHVWHKNLKSDMVQSQTRCQTLPWQTFLPLASLLLHNGNKRSSKRSHEHKASALN